MVYGKRTKAHRKAAASLSEKTGEKKERPKALNTDKKSHGGQDILLASPIWVNPDQEDHGASGDDENSDDLAELEQRGMTDEAFEEALKKSVLCRLAVDPLQRERENTFKELTQAFAQICDHVNLTPQQRLQNFEQLLVDIDNRARDAGRRVSQTDSIP